MTAETSPKVLAGQQNAVRFHLPCGSSDAPGGVSRDKVTFARQEALLVFGSERARRLVNIAKKVRMARGRRQRQNELVQLDGDRDDALD
jgi:hypothetical protein